MKDQRKFTESRINFTKFTLMDFWVHPIAHNLILLRKIQKSDRLRSWWHLLVFFFLHLHLHTKRMSKKEDWPHSEMVQSGSIDFILKITLIHFANATSDSEGPCFVSEQSIFQSSASVSCPWLTIFANLRSESLNRGDCTTLSISFDHKYRRYRHMQSYSQARLEVNAALTFLRFPPGWPHCIVLSW